MGHATHFLERLERLSSPQADFALELYRDSALVRFVLEHSRLPDGAERVALGVDQRPGGPHIVVTRDGKFVTCLGAGMSTNDLPVITRGQVEHMGSRFEGLRAASARSRDRVELRRLLRNVMEKGTALSREDFTALAAMLPILDTVYGRAATETASFLMNFQRRYTRSRYRRMTDKVVGELRHYWASWWGVGHLIALCGTRGSELASTVARTREEETFVSYTMSRMTMYSMILPVMLRGGWAAGRVGRGLVLPAKDNLRRAVNFVDMVCHALPLVVIALRHRGARAEVQKVLARTRRRAKETMCSPLDHVLSEPLLERFEQVLDPEVEASCAQLHRRTGAAFALSIAEHLPEGHPHRYASIEEVPDELALALPMCMDEDLFGGFESLVLLTILLPWLAGAEAADFYLPADLLAAYSTAWNQWSPEKTLAVLDDQHRYYLRDRPVRARSTPGRNEPCPCGSGSKYKRCCGA